jgi:hypothetical protein
MRHRLTPVDFRSAGIGRGKRVVRTAMLHGTRRTRRT